MEAQSKLEAGPDNAIVWQDQRLYLLDQRILPHRLEFVACESAAEVAVAIEDMIVRGAPAIGITAAYGVVLAVREGYVERGADWRRGVEDDMQLLARARPTAANLFLGP